MATNPQTFPGLEGGGVGGARRPWRGLDLTTLRWIVGVGGVLALLILAALPGPTPDAQADRAARVEAAAPAVLDGHGKWRGYTP